MGAIGCGGRLVGESDTGLIEINSFAIKQDSGLSTRAKNQQAQVGLHEMA